MNVAICGERETELALLASIAAAAGANRTAAYERADGDSPWSERFAEHLVAAEGFLEERDPAVVLVGGAGPVSLAVALAATRAGIPLARVVVAASERAGAHGRDAALTDHLATLLICFSDEDREALGAAALDRLAVSCETPDQAGAAISSLVPRRHDAQAP